MRSASRSGWSSIEKVRASSMTCSCAFGRAAASLRPSSTGKNSSSADHLHVGVDRRPDVERLDGLVDQGVELRQHPVGEIAGGVLPLGIADELDVLGMGVGGLGRGDRAAAHHQVERDAGAAARGLDVGGRRIIGRRLDEAGDDRRLGDRERRRAVPEEAARGGVDAVGAAAEIDAVQIEFEDLVLGEAPFERERQDRLAQLAGEGALVGEEDVAGELLGDGRDAAHPVAAGDAEPEAADDADRIDAEMRAEAAVLDRDHRVAHHRRDPVVGQPFAEHRAHRLDDRRHWRRGPGSSGRDCRGGRARHSSAAG